MNTPEFINNFLEEVKTVCNSQQVQKNIEDFVVLLKKTREKSKKVIFAGNGASATIASHAALDIMNQINVECIALNDPNILTCFSNDFGYEYAFERWLQLIANSGDLVVLISSSGESKNILNAQRKALQLGCKIVTFSGFNENNSLKTNPSEIDFWCKSKTYNIVETVHMIWIAAACDLIVEQERDKVGLHGCLLGTPNEIKYL